MMRASKTESPHPVDFITNFPHVVLSLWSVQFFSCGVLVCMYEWPLQSLPLPACCNYCCMINNSSDSRSLAGCPLLLRGCYHACALVCMCEACAERDQGRHVSGLVSWIQMNCCQKAANYTSITVRAGVLPLHLYGWIISSSWGPLLYSYLTLAEIWPWWIFFPS